MVATCGGDIVERKGVLDTELWFNKNDITFNRVGWLPVSE